MFAVVQIGSSERRSPCITARMVRAREGCAYVLCGSAVSAVVASVPCTKRRRVVRIEVLPLCWADLLMEGGEGTRGPHGEERRDPHPESHRSLRPHPEERGRRPSVSKDGSTLGASGHPSRRHA